MRRMSVQPVLRCRGVARSFQGPREQLAILRSVDLEVDAGETVMILGPSGSGKSTLLHLLAGLDAPDAGEIWWGDVPIHGRRPRDLASERSRNVGLVFQNHYLLAELDALDNVALPGRITGSRDGRRAEELLRAVGLAGRSGHRPSQLSGGERQRVAVARALYARPAILLADEPTGSLDRDHAHAVFDLLLELASTEGSAVLVVTHDESLLGRVDRAHELRDGSLQAHGVRTARGE